jgi:predicted dinucleotide-binding enzyme
MTCVIIGGTGYIGQRWARRLASLPAGVSFFIQPWLTAFANSLK